MTTPISEPARAGWCRIVPNVPARVPQVLAMRAFPVLFALALATLAATPRALAQADERGYGGPATVGPNFSTGKQSAPPDYGSGAPKKKTQGAAPPPKSQKAARKPPEAPPAKPKAIAKETPAPAPAPPATTAEPAPQPAAEPGTADTAATTPSATAPAGESTPPAPKAQSCRRFDATTGTTIEVACE